MTNERNEDGDIKKKGTPRRQALISDLRRSMSGMGPSMGSMERNLRALKFHLS